MDDLNRLEIALQALLFADPPETASYTYIAIPDGAPIIRILTLHPGHVDAPLAGTIKFAPLRGSIRYEALSYVWGSSKKPFKIDIAGKTLPITASLQLALQRLRRQDSPRDIWIDALCMNQQDEREKGYQLGFMGEIYSRATCVQCFLGPDNQAKDGAKGLELLQKVQRAGPMPGRKITKEWIEAEGLPARFDRRWQQVLYFLSLPWFKRRWTVQEFVKATSFRFICGEAEADWRDIQYGLHRWEQCNFMGWARKRGTATDSDWSSFWDANEGSLAIVMMLKIKMKTESIGLSTNVLRDSLETGVAHESLPDQWKATLELCRRFGQEFTKLAWASIDAVGDYITSRGIRRPGFNGKQYPLKALLEMCENNQASDPRDYIYALLSMAADSKDISKQLSYTEPVEILYTRCARCLIESNDPFETILKANRQKPNVRLEGLPSWVPDWSQHAWTMGKSQLLVRSLSSDIYNANSFTRPQIRFDPNDLSLLFLKGSFIGTIVHTIEPPLINVNDLSTIFTPATASFLREIDNRYNEKHRASLWRILIANTTFTALPAFQTAIPEDTYEESYFGARAALGVPAPGHERSEASTAAFFTDMTTDMPSGSWAADWLLTLTYYSFCETSTGRLGQAPPGTLKGDRVFVAFGCKMPLVLRAAGKGKWKLIGAAYVHGMMQGEAMALGEWKEEEIALV